MVITLCEVSVRSIGHMIAASAFVLLGNTLETIISTRNSQKNVLETMSISTYSCADLFDFARVSVPGSNLFNIVTVRCGHCASLLSVNMVASLQTVPPQDPQSQKSHQKFEDLSKDGSGSSSRSNNKVTTPESADNEPPRVPPIRPPEKRQRVPSAYNRFIKEEIQRIKASNPDISHREAFSAAAKNWAHFPHIHFGLKMDSNKLAKLDRQSFAGEGTKKPKGFYEINGTL